MNKRDARRILREVRDTWDEFRTNRDAGFVFGTLRDALAALDARGASAYDLGLAAGGYALLGDIRDLVLCAPRAAARAYRRAVRCDPGDAWSWSELGGMLNDVGEYRAALRALHRADALEPDVFLTGLYLEEATDAVRDPDEWWRYRDGALPGKPAPSWTVCELLADERPREALDMLRRKRHPYLVQLRGRARAALGDVDGFLDEWERLAGTKGEVAIERGDWFFLPRSIRDEPRFWRALHALRHRLGFGPWWSGHAALEDSIVPEPAGRPGTQAALGRLRRRLALLFRYEIARTERDARRATSLASRYPQWREAVALARRLGAS
jgi:tetratricopeptide (TPR) repeat protein